MASTPPSPPPTIEEADDGSSSTPYSTPKFQPARPRRRTRRTLSFSSSSSSSSSSFSFNNDESTLFSPASIRGPLLQRIPFSWEQVPGIPKQQQHFKIKLQEQSTSSVQQLDLVPLQLPPAAVAGTYCSTKKIYQDDQEPHMISPKKHHHYTRSSFHRDRDGDDPFLAALVKCSKDDNHIHHDSMNWKLASPSSASSSSRGMSSLSDRFGFISIYTSCKRTCAVSESIVYLPKRPTPHYLLNHRR